MSSPLPPQLGETSAQRQARLNAAYAVQTKIDTKRRAELAARAKALASRLAVRPSRPVMPSPVMPPPVMPTPDVPFRPPPMRPSPVMPPPVMPTPDVPYRSAPDRPMPIMPPPMRPMPVMPTPVMPGNEFAALRDKYSNTAPLASPRDPKFTEFYRGGPVMRYR